MKTESKMSVIGRHELKIAKQTLQMHDVGAAIMGGMTKGEARQFLRKMGWSAERIQKLEQ
jgi:hypothetical protein